MRDGERQVAPLLREIRRDHTARYEWATRVLPKGARVVDFACGCGYGTWTLAAHGCQVTGYDLDPEALGYAREHYAHKNAKFETADAKSPPEFGEIDAAVCFETVEHVADPRPLLKALRASAPLLLVSVPNEDVIPFGPGFDFHFRHYTAGQFELLLKECGWRVREWHGQQGMESEVERNRNGRTIVVVAERAEEKQTAPEPEHKPITHEQVMEEMGVPEHVVILGLGPSLERYVDIAKRLGGKHAYADEVWGINAVGGVVLCDRVFHMDDVRIQEARAKELPESNIARMMEWIKVHPGPIITSRAHPDYPGLVEFPLAEVINKFGHPYFNGTAAYAIAYALFIGVKKLSIFGVDFTYPNAHHAEKGRACCEFWLGLATAAGIKISIPKESTLMDALHTEAERLYGYDTLDVRIVPQEDKIIVEKTERKTIASAAEIENRYDHSQHPNALLKDQ